MSAFNLPPGCLLRDIDPPEKQFDENEERINPEIERADREEGWDE